MFNRSSLITLGLVVWLAQVAIAAPQRAAIVNLAGQRGIQASAKLRSILANRDNVVLTPTRDLANALEGKLPPSCTQLAAPSAALLITKSEVALDGFQHELAMAQLEQARQQLERCVPTEQTNKLLAQTLFTLAVTLLRENNEASALETLRLAHRIENNRPELSAVRFPPNVRDLDAVARNEPTDKTSTIVFSNFAANAVVYINGHKIRNQQPIELPPGRHWVVVDAPSRIMFSRRVELLPGDSRSIQLDTTDKSSAQLATEYRNSYMREPSQQQANRVAHQIATLSATELVFLLLEHDVKNNNALAAALYTIKNQQLSKPNALTNNYRATVDKLLPRSLFNRPPSPTDPAPRWYQKRWAKASFIGAGIVAAGVASFAVFRSSSSTQDWGIGQFSR